MLNKHSGLLAVSGLSSDMREVMEAMESGDRIAGFAFEMFTYRIRKYIGAYAAAMNGLDVLVFTAGIGENSKALRKAVCSGLTFLGIELDEERNRIGRGQDRFISKEGSKVDVLVIPTNEEWMIARDTYALISGDEAPGPQVKPEQVPGRGS